VPANDRTASGGRRRANAREIELARRAHPGDYRRRARWRRGRRGVVKGITATADFYRPERRGSGAAARLSSATRVRCARGDGVATVSCELMSELPSRRRRKPFKVSPTWGPGGHLHPVGRAQALRPLRHAGRTTITRCYEVEAGVADSASPSRESSGGEGTVNIQRSNSFLRLARSRPAARSSSGSSGPSWASMDTPPKIKRVWLASAILAAVQRVGSASIRRREKITVASNAEAARRCARRRRTAALAGDARAQALRGLKTDSFSNVEESGQHDAVLVVGRSCFPPSGSDKTSLLVSARGHRGAGRAPASSRTARAPRRRT